MHYREHYDLQNRKIHDIILLGLAGAQNYVQTLGECRHLEEMVAQCTIFAHPRCYFTYKFRY
jgi:hypothetical protein